MVGSTKFAAALLALASMNSMALADQTNPSLPAAPNADGFLAQTRTDEAISEGMRLSCVFSRNGSPVQERFLSAKFDDRLLDNVILISFADENGFRYSTLLKEGKQIKGKDGVVYTSSFDRNIDADSEEVIIDNFSTGAISDFTGTSTAAYTDINTVVTFERQNGKVVSLDFFSATLKKGGIFSFGSYKWEEVISAKCR